MYLVSKWVGFTLCNSPTQSHNNKMNHALIIRNQNLRKYKREWLKTKSDTKKKAYTKVIWRKKHTLHWIEIWQEGLQRRGGKKKKKGERDCKGRTNGDTRIDNFQSWILRWAVICHDHYIKVAITIQHKFYFQFGDIHNCGPQFIQLSN